MKKQLYILCLLPVLVLGQSSEQNWVKKVEYKEPTTTSIPDVTIENASTTVTYIDGLGRPIQVVNKQQSNSGRSIVKHIDYDQYGRSLRDFLPYVSETNGVNFETNEIDNTFNEPLYNGEVPFSEKQVEDSPLQRVLKQSAPGDTWFMGSGNEIEFKYDTNIADEVKLYRAQATWNETYQLYYISLIDNSDYYDENQLYKNIVKDENWQSGKDNTTEEFKDKEGKVVLKRTYNLGEKHDTYYVYDQYGNLTYVIPPLVNTESAISQDILNNLCYQYKYDSRNRMVEKKLPAKDWEYIVYNVVNLPVATGPAKNPNGDGGLGWMITKYDAFQRVIYTGWYDGIETSSSGRREYSQIMNGYSIAPFEAKFHDGTTIDNIIVDYTDRIYPKCNENPYTLLTINYYDEYNFPHAPQSFGDVADQPIFFKNDADNKPLGLQTGTWVRIPEIGTDLKAETSYTLYDFKARPIKNHIVNYLGGEHVVNTKYDFSGKIIYTESSSYRMQNELHTTILDEYTYSPQGRVISHFNAVNGGIKQLLAFNHYDELGQLINKKVGGQDLTGNNPMQSIDYGYNIRGWLKSINNVEELSKDNDPVDLFAFKINYDTVENEENYDGQPLYNGNISETFWRTSSDNVLRKYGYFYDSLNRLNSAVYQKPGGAIPVPNSYNEELVYDKNGNIRRLRRNGNMDSDTSYYPSQGIDELNYTYAQNSNQLLKVDDQTGDINGFKDGENTDDDYTYDNFGNMLSDKNKGIEKIKYNHLNLPTLIEFGSLGTIKYIYSATGQKMQKRVKQGNTEKVTDYLYGFQYVDNVLKFFNHAEGFVNVTGGQNNTLIYDYVFNYTDHLGNIRLSYGFDNATQSTKIIEQNHYYPFGLKHTNYNSDDRIYYRQEEEINTKLRIRQPAESVYKYKYNGKELQDELGLNLYDYGARNYDPAIGRWMNIDPKAENSRKWTPYNYAYNNPMYFVDPDGMRAFDWVSINGQMVNDRRVIDQKTATEHYGSKALYRAPGYEYTTEKGNNVVLGEKGQFTLDGKSYKSPDLAPSSLSEGNSASNQAIMLGTEGTTAFVASQFKSNDNPFSFNSLKDNQTAWRTKAVLGKTGANALGLVKGLGNVTAIATPAFHGYEIYNRPDGSTTTMEQVDLGVEIFGAGTVIGTMLGYISNPVGWSIGTASTAYSAFRFGQSNDVMEEIRSEPGLNGCFAEGTLITMSDGSDKEIQDVKVGDLILTYNLKTSQLEPKKVIQKFNPIRNEIITIEFDNGVKNTNTTDHPYFVENKKWSSFSPELTFKNYNFKVNQIEKGDSCFYISKGKLVKVKIVSFEVTNSITKTYNLSDVEDNNNFFANGILVHNKN